MFWFSRTLGSSLLAGVTTLGAATVTVDRVEPDRAEAGFVFPRVPRPAKNDAASGLAAVLVSGRADPNSGGLSALCDGRVPESADAPRSNFFFDAGTDGGKWVLDLGKPVAIRCVNTYSWHPDARGPQVFTLYGSLGEMPGFQAAPGAAVVLTNAGWELIAKVDTRPPSGETGGQYGVTLSADAGSLGTFRHLLFDVARTQPGDRFANTFFSEIDVIDQAGPAPEPVDAATVARTTETMEFGDGRYTLVLETIEAGDLLEWARAEALPMTTRWYPKLVELLPSEGFEAPRKITLLFDGRMRGVAETSGSRVRCSASWFRSNLRGEALGAVFHEWVHVVQRYGNLRPQPGSAQAPGWLVEGIADYLRWYQFEPEAKGAEITARNLAGARYDGSYRVTANFLNWVVSKAGPGFILRMNAAIREGRYGEGCWAVPGGGTLGELGAAWKAEHAKRLGAADGGR
jgi:hypothetical protein